MTVVAAATAGPAAANPPRLCVWLGNGDCWHPQLLRAPPRTGSGSHGGDDLRRRRRCHGSSSRPAPATRKARLRRPLTATPVAAATAARARMGCRCACPRTTLASLHRHGAAATATRGGQRLRRRLHGRYGCGCGTCSAAAATPHLRLQPMSACRAADVVAATVDTNGRVECFCSRRFVTQMTRHGADAMLQSSCDCIG